MSAPTAMRQVGDDVELDIIVSPRASQTAIVGMHGDRIKVQLAAPPVDGAANRALIEHLAKRLGVGRRELELRRGHKGRKKTLRVLGRSLETVRRDLALLALAAATFVLGACEARVEAELSVILPEERAALQDVDNASVVLLSQNEFYSFAVDGLDFELELDLPEDGGPHELELYLAKGETLRAWGRSASFEVGVGDTPAVYVGPPGRLSTFPREIDDPDPDLRVAALRGRGALLLHDDGASFFLSNKTLDTAALAALPEASAFQGGCLVGMPDGGALRLGLGASARASYFDPATNAWLELEAPTELDGLDASTPTALSSDEGQLVIWSPAGARSLDLDFDPRADALALTPLDGGIPLDAARTGAHATPDFLFGSDDPSPVVWGLEAGALGPSGPWVGARCVQLEASRWLCGGGLREDQPSADLVELRREAQSWNISELGAALGEPMRDPWLWTDDLALYAQSDGRLRALDLADLSVRGDESDARRHARGQFFRLDSGVTFQAGGTDEIGAPLTRWQVFLPDIAP